MSGKEKRGIKNSIFDGYTQTFNERQFSVDNGVEPKKSPRYNSKAERIDSYEFKIKEKNEKEIIFNEKFNIKKFIYHSNGLYVIDYSNKIYDQDGQLLPFGGDTCGMVAGSYNKDLFLTNKKNSKIYNKENKVIYKGKILHDMACSPDNKLFIRQGRDIILNHTDGISYYTHNIKIFRFSPSGKLFIQSTSNKIYNQKHKSLYIGKNINDFKASSSKKLFIWEDSKGIVNEKGKIIYNKNIEKIRAFRLSPDNKIFILQGSNTIVNEKDKAVYRSQENFYDFTITPQKEMIIQESTRLVKIKL